MNLKQDNTHGAAECLKVLSNPLRLKILFLISEKPMNVSSIEKLTGASQSNVSQHLAIMRYKGFVESEKKGTEVYYKIGDEKLKELIKVIGDLLCD